jgi:hypothetical protein
MVIFVVANCGVEPKPRAAVSIILNTGRDRLICDLRLAYVAPSRAICGEKIPYKWCWRMPTRAKRLLSENLLCNASEAGSGAGTAAGRSVITTSPSPVRTPAIKAAELDQPGFAFVQAEPKLRQSSREIGQHLLRVRLVFEEQQIVIGKADQADRAARRSP